MCVLERFDVELDLTLAIARVLHAGEESIDLTIEGYRINGKKQLLPATGATSVITAQFQSLPERLNLDAHLCLPIIEELRFTELVFDHSANRWYLSCGGPGFCIACSDEEYKSFRDHLDDDVYGPGFEEFMHSAPVDLDPNPDFSLIEDYEYGEELLMRTRLSTSPFGRRAISGAGHDAVEFDDFD